MVPGSFLGWGWVCSCIQVVGMPRGVVMLMGYIQRGEYPLPTELGPGIPQDMVSKQVAHLLAQSFLVICPLILLFNKTAFQ